MMAAAIAIHPDAELRTLGRHRIVAKLGQGGMANVYLTVVRGQHGVNKLFVAKVLLDDLALDADFRSMFLKEARVATLLHHRNLVQSFEVAETDGHHYITMEYLEGRPLHTIVAVIGRSSMPLDAYVGILALALTGLHSAHEQTDLTGQRLDLVHRDVSPQNIFVTFDGEVKVVDFGVAKVRGGTVTETGSFFGKIGYIAPEQAASGPTDRRADIFAVGIMLWEAITRRSFVERGEGEAVALRKRLNGEIPSPREVVPDGPEELMDICEKAIAYEAADRYATAAEFEEALHGYLEKKGARVGAKEISAVVLPHFADDRARMRSLLEDRLANLDAAPVDLGAPGDASGPAASRSRPISTSPARASGRVLLAVGGVCLVALAALAVRALTTTSPEPALSSRTNIDVPSALATAGATASPRPESAPAERTTVRAKLRAIPSSATLTLDGTPLASNPFSGDLPRDGAVHVLTASADGYVTATHDVHFDHDVDVDLALVAAPRAPPPLPATPRMGRPVAPASRPARPVDDKDPYAK